MRHSVTCHASRVSVSFLMTEADDEAVLGRGTVRERGRDVTEAEVTRLVSTEAGVRLVSVHQGGLGGPDTPVPGDRGPRPHAWGDLQ